MPSRFQALRSVCLYDSCLFKIKKPLIKINNGIEAREIEFKKMANHHESPPKKSGLPYTESTV
jgi:hypothetical protein